MRAKIPFAATISAALLDSTPLAIAQTGEFVAHIPGSVVHDGWELQDKLQRARSGMTANSVDRRYPRYGASNYVKPPVSVTTANGTNTRE
jgi:hypothetical protein